MKLARIIRFSIIKFVRFWNPRWRAFWSELYYALEPLKKINNSSCKNDCSDHEKAKSYHITSVTDTDAIDQRPYEDGTCDQEKDTNKKIKAIGSAFFKFIELLALIAAVATAWVIFAQFQEMQRTTGVANGQLKAMEGQLASSYIHKGYGKEIGQVLIQHDFDVIKFDTIFGVMYLQHFDSIALCNTSRYGITSRIPI